MWPYKHLVPSETLFYIPSFVCLLKMLTTWRDRFLKHNSCISCFIVNCFQQQHSWINRNDPFIFALEILTWQASQLSLTQYYGTAPCQSSGSSATRQHQLKKSTLYLSTLNVERPTLTKVFQVFLWEKGLRKCHSFKTPSRKFWSKKKRLLTFGAYRAKDLCYLFNLYRGSEHQTTRENKNSCSIACSWSTWSSHTNLFTTPTAIQIIYSILLQTHHSFLLIFI